MSEPMTDEQLNKLATIRWEQPGLVVSGFDATAEIRQLRRELAEPKAAFATAVRHEAVLEAERDAARRECEAWRAAVDRVSQFGWDPGIDLEWADVCDRIRREAERLIAATPSASNTPPSPAAAEPRTPSPP